MFKKIAKIAVAVAALFGGLATPVAQADPIADIMRTLPAGSSIPLPAVPGLPLVPGAVPADVQIVPGYRADDRLNWLCTSGSCRKYLSAPELDNQPKLPPEQAQYPAWRMSQGFVVTDYYLVRNDVLDDLKYSYPQFKDARSLAAYVCGDPSRYRLVKYDMRRGTETATATSGYCV